MLNLGNEGFPDDRSQKHNVEVVTSDFQRVLDQLKVTLNRCDKTLGQLLFGEQPPRAPRYFQVVFLALHKLIVVENQEVLDQDQLVKLMDGSGKQITVPEGGRWGTDDRAKSVNAKVILTHCAKVKVTHLGEDDGFLGAVDVDPGGSSGDTSDGPKGRIDQGNSQGIRVFPQYGTPVSA